MTTWNTNLGFMPVPKGTLIDIEHLEGDVYECVEAGYGVAEDWAIEYHPRDIVKWRLNGVSANDKIKEEVVYG